MGLFDFMSSNKFAAANNAVIVKHMIDYELSAEDKSLFKGQILRILQKGGGGGDESYQQRMFDNANPLAQLNVIALAAMDLNYTSNLVGGELMAIRNPFKEIPTESQIDIAVQGLRRKNSNQMNDIGLDFNKIDISGWG